MCISKRNQSKHTHITHTHYITTAFKQRKQQFLSVFKYSVGAHTSVIVFNEVHMLVYLWMYIFIVPFNHDAQTRHTHCTWYVSCRHLLIGSFSPHFSLAAFMLLLLLIKKLSCFFFCSHSLNFAYCIPIVLFYMFLCPLYFLYWQFYAEDLIKFPFNFLLPFLFFLLKKAPHGSNCVFPSRDT